MDKIIHIVGARPQFIKASAVFNKMAGAGSQQLMVHTGQHYDFNMSEVFFRELEMEEPDFSLGIGSYGHGEQTGRMLIELERVLLEEEPALAVVYGDTNTTLAGALAASKLHIPIAHVEAGLRSFNRDMPEEINRIVADHLSTLLFTPTRAGQRNLERESLVGGVHRVGDVMLDIALRMSEKRDPVSVDVLSGYGLRKGKYMLVTVHRADNTDKPENLRSIFNGLKEIAEQGIDVFFPVHPRTMKCFQQYEMLVPSLPEKLHLHEPVPYGDMLVLEKNASVVITDSGGVQKEAYFFKTPAVIPRDETEWTETVEAGWNRLTGADSGAIVENAIELAQRKDELEWENYYGDGTASEKIAHIVADYIREGGHHV